MTPRSDLPAGIVTFVFTDIEGSTQLLHELGPQGFDSALIEHRRALRDAFARHGGVEVDTQGDAFFYAFPDARGAVQAAREGRDELVKGPIRVRIGIHTGTPHLGAEGYIGPDVHLGARIGAAGHGGQVLLSKETRDLIDADAIDLGEHRLKDFEQPVWIYQLGTESFPPLKTISNTNLPRPASSFIGRERERDQVIALLRRGTRLVTLTGPGGTGKTRLSIEAAGELVGELPNGVFWVGLATLRDPALVTATIAQTLGAKDGLADHIGERDMLLVLDNFEQVVDAAHELSTVLKTCPNLKVLVTSRELLRIDGEIDYPVPPLANAEAIELFCTRSGLDADDAIAELCRRLDDLPLAVELAAARTGVLSPNQILERLAARLDLLKGGRDADPRQQTLRATIEWSYDLLSDDEKQLFARLAVFRGGCTFETAEEVIDADLDTLQSLVDKSLVRHTQGRFWMFETIREFALECLDASHESDAVRARHVSFFVGTAQRADRELRANPKEQLDSLERDQDNFRSAQDQLERLGDTRSLLDIGAGLWRLWYQRGPIEEGRQRIESALKRDNRATASRARALVGAAALALNNGDADTGLKHAEESVAIARELDDPELSAHAVSMLASALTDKDDFARAKPLFEESRNGYREIGDHHYEGVATLNLAYCLRELGETEAAGLVAREGLEAARLAGNRRNEAGFLDEIAIELLDFHEDPGEAVSHLRQGLAIWWDERDMFSVGRNLYRLARANATLGNAARGAPLLAAATRMYEEMNAGEAWFWEWVEKTKGMLREQLDEERFAALWQEGRAMTIEEAVALALEP